MTRFITAITLSLALFTLAPYAGAQAADGSLPSLPTPSELIAKMKSLQAEADTKTKVAYLDLSDAISEKPRSFSLFGNSDSDTLREIVSRLHQARDDKEISAVLITLGANLQLNLAQAQEIRDALLDVRRAGKKTFVYADAYDTDSYTLASGATNVCLPQGGEIMMPGVGLQATFYKGTFDKVGVSADYVQIGEYKGAEEPYTRTTASEELKGEMNKLTEALFGQVIDGISLSRNLSSQLVRSTIDDAMMTATVAKERGFVDHLVEQDGLRALLKEELGNEVELKSHYGEEESPELDLSNPLLLLAALNRKPEVSDKPAVAIIYAEGVITDGKGDGGLLSEGGIGSDAMRRTLRIAERDENIKAIVLRIDSPGGSALASEVIWQAIRRVSQESKKPVIISVGAMAASGGYYMASAGDYIFADRCAILGSIGVVGGKFVVKDLYDKIGLSSDSFLQGRNADLFSENSPFSDRQRRMMRTWMQQTYDQFTQRVMTTRNGKIKDIDKVARGRVFIAQQARDLGMVDELGGCDEAIAYAAKQAHLDTGDYDVRSLPAPKSLLEMISSGDPEALTPIRPQININSAMLALPAQARREIGRQLQLMQLLQSRAVVLLAPYSISTP